MFNPIDLFFGYIAGLITLIVVKSVIEPIATRLGQIALQQAYNKAKTILPDIWDSLDLEWLSPTHIERTVSTYEWLIETCIPEKAAAKGIELNDEMAKKLAKYTLEHFDIDSYLSKIKI